MPRRGEAAARSGAAAIAGILPASALDERVAIVGTSGSGKTYAAKGWVERLLDVGARVCVVDPLGVWWGLRACANPQGSAEAKSARAGYPVVVFGGRHADIALDESMGMALGHLIGTGQLACVVDLSELGSSAARRRFMAAFAEAVYEANTEPLHLVLDEADLWAPQRPQPDAYALLGRIEEIVRRGRVRGFIPWLITQRPAVVHKDVLSQADILVAMKLTASQDRDAVGGWIEGQADRSEGKRILAELPRLGRGEGYLWAPGHDVLARIAFPAIRTFDSSRTPRRGERIATPDPAANPPGFRELAEVDLPAITAALAEARGPGEERSGSAGSGSAPLTALRRQLTERKHLLTAAQARVAELEMALAEAERGQAELREQLDEIARLASGHANGSLKREGSRKPQSGFGEFAAGNGAERSVAAHAAAPIPIPSVASENGQPPRSQSPRPTVGTRSVGADLHPAARKLLAALAQHAPARFTWGQAATLAGLKPSGGHYNAGRKQLRDQGFVEEAAELVAASPAGLEAAGEVPPAPSTSAERLALWCERLPSSAPEMLRTLAARGELHRSHRPRGHPRQKAKRRALEQRPRPVAQQRPHRSRRQAPASKRAVPLITA